MNDKDILHHLESIASALNLKVSYAEFAGADWRTSSGLCRVGDDLHIIVDKHLSVGERASVLCRCLKGFNLEGLYCPPLIRQRIEE